MRAGERLAHAADSWATGGALYRQAEVHRVLGDFPAAEDAYQQASRWGLEPQPGLALLRLAQGRTDAAASGIRRTLAETTDRLGPPSSPPRSRSCSPSATSREHATPLAADRDRRALPHPALRGGGPRPGAMLLAEGDARAALVALRGAGAAWQELEAPAEAARVRRAWLPGAGGRGGRGHGAGEAPTVFAQLGAAPDLARLEALAHQEAAGKAHGLTERELQVLRLVATGATNHAIASQLFVAEKTVDRHVSNIFTKLGGLARRGHRLAYQHRLL